MLEAEILATMGEKLMHTLKDRIKAVKLYVKYGKSAVAVTREFFLTHGSYQELIPAYFVPNNSL